VRSTLSRDETLSVQHFFRRFIGVLVNALHIVPQRLRAMTAHSARRVLGAVIGVWALIGILSGGPVQAQAINARWTGTWLNEHGTERLVISERQFAISQTTCQWSTTVPKQFKRCHAYYEGSLTRAQIQQALEESEKHAQNMLRQGADPKTTKAVQEQFRRNRQVMARISNDTFKLIQTNSPEKEMGSGDCGEVFFLDKETIYQLSQCAPAPEAFTLTPYRRLNQ
jgi:arsenate reductase-like glutaredoxin family protein